MTTLDVSALVAGSRVTSELMVRAREDKTTKNGDPFAILQLGNATGAIQANVWKEQLPEIAGLKPGSIVQVIGTVETYQNKRQLKLTAPPRLVAASAANLDEFLPRISVAAERLWEQVDKWRDEEPLKFAEGAFDLVYCRLLLCHLQRPLEALREMRSLLKPGGVLVCEDRETDAMFSECS